MSSELPMVLMILTGVLSIAVLLLGAITWRQVLADRRRSEARIAALAQAIDQPVDGELAEDSGTPQRDHGHADRMALAIPDARGPSRAPAFAIAVAVVVGAGALLAAGMTGGRNATADPHASGSPRIELLAMRHAVERDRLIVSGLVRNPGTRPSPRLAAVVSVIGRDGQVIARRESPLEPAILAGGKETPFRVSVADVTDPDRYRVAFSSDRGIIPHVDRRTDPARAARASGSGK